MHRFSRPLALLPLAALPLTGQSPIQFPSTAVAGNQPTRTYTFPSHPSQGVYAREIVPGDVDGDADPDLFVLGPGMRLYINGVPDPTAGNVVQSIPSPAYGTFADWTVGPNQVPRVDPVTSHVTDGFLADMDADGDADLVVCTDAPGGGDVWMLLNGRMTNTGGGIGVVGPLAFVDAEKPAWGWTIQNPPSPALLFGIAPADFDGDGDIDFVCAADLGASSSVLLYTNNFPTKSLTVTTLASFAGNARDLAVGDLDGLGLPDVAVAVENAPNVVLRSSAGYAPAALPTPAGNGTIGLSVAIGQVTGTAAADVVIGHFPGLGVAGNDVLYRNDGAFGFTALVIAKPVSQSSDEVDLFDMDEDGDLDYVASTSQSTAGTRTLLFENVAGTLVAALGRIADDGASGFYSEAMAVVDVDLDLDLDIVTAYWSQNQIALFPNHMWQLDADPALPAAGGTLGIDTYNQAGFSGGGLAGTWMTVQEPVRPVLAGPFGHPAMNSSTWVALTVVGHGAPGGHGNLLLPYASMPLGAEVWLQSLVSDFVTTRATNITRTEFQ